MLVNRKLASLFIYQIFGKLFKFHFVFNCFCLATPVKEVILAFIFSLDGKNTCVVFVFHYGFWSWTFYIFAIESKFEPWGILIEILYCIWEKAV